MQGVDETRGRSRWRYLALPLVPVVAGWDLLKAVARAWGEFGVRMLDRLDPFFARFAAAWMRLAERFTPVFRRVVAPFQWIGERFESITSRVARFFAAVFAPLRRVAAEVGAALAPTLAAVRRAVRWVTTPLRWAGRTMARAWQALRAMLARGWAAVRRAASDLFAQR